MYFAVPADHRVKLQESEKRVKYLEPGRELNEKILNRKVIVIPIVIGALGVISKELVKGLEGLEIKWQMETSALLRSAKIWGES